VLRLRLGGRDRDGAGAGATPDRISFGNTIKKERDIARAYELGVRLFAVDCEAEVEKIARAAPGSKVFCRILCDGAGAEWPLSRKFGCEPADGAARARACPAQLGLSPMACRSMSARSSAR
jgi:ornithine decarboxylase